MVSLYIREGSSYVSLLDFQPPSAYRPQGSQVEKACIAGLTPIPKEVRSLPPTPCDLYV
jgi:hypothetical protein